VLLLFLAGPYSFIGQLCGGALTDSFTGIVLAQTFVAAPFLVIAARSAFAGVDPVYEDVAATLGHHSYSRFFRVTLPLAWPAIRAGLALAWLRASGEFGATMMVAYHPYSLPVYTYVMFGSQGLPAMMPLLLPTLAIAAACAILLSACGLRAHTAHPTMMPQDDGSDAPIMPIMPVMRSNAGTVASPRLKLDLKRTLGPFSLDIQWQPVMRRLAIIGPSGSGKSLALRIIAGLERNEGGSVMLGATDLAALAPEHRQTGYLPQDYGLFAHMNVAQQLAFPANANAASARYWLHHLGLNGLVDRLPHQLSAGQRQRVALARAFSRHSQLLLFDEPFAALDTPRRKQLQESLRTLQRDMEAVTILVTHDPDEAALLADEILVIEQGRVLQAGMTDDVFARPASLRVAGLLGINNVGEGRVRAPGEIETPCGLRLRSTQCSAHAGERVMWRVPHHAIVPANDGPYRGTIISQALRGGNRYVTLEIGGQPFVMPDDGTGPPSGIGNNDDTRFAIDASEVLTWPPCVPHAAHH
jgi:molybdate transport system permease protein